MKTEIPAGKLLTASAVVAAASLSVLFSPAQDAPPGQIEFPPAFDEAAPELADETSLPSDPAPDGLDITVEPRDSIDASAPHDPELAKLLRRAEDLIQRGEGERAQEVLRFAIDRGADSVVLRTDGTVSPVVDEANRLLDRLPSDLLDLYRRQYGPAAEKTLAEAVQTGRLDLLQQVADQFRQTPAGRKAIERLAAIHLDRAEFGLAARRYRDLLADARPVEPRVRLQAATAFLRSGNAEAAREQIAALSEAERAALGKLPSGGDRLNLLAADEVPSSPSPTAEDWRIPFGDPARSAVSAAGEPLLLRRWFQPLTDRSGVRDQSVRVTSDLRNADRATIPAALPLAVGDRVIVRTLRGVEVYSATDGRLLWETDEGLSPERILSGEANVAIDPEMRQVFRFRGQFGLDPSQGTPGEENGLASLLYRDGVTGFLSADAERLYVIEDNAALTRPQTGFGWDDQEADPYGRDRSANRIAAYDLETGRPAWTEQGSIGGPSAAAPFEQALAGYFFFGPPTPVGDDLYVIGEKNKEIRLLALDPETGSLRRDRLLAHAQVGIDQDSVRRGWPAQIAAADGVLVCPTTVGWLVGVEQSSHSILWAYRYAPPQPRIRGDEANLVTPATVLNSLWSPSAPVIRNGRVVFTPSEEARLVCLDLNTGELRWRHGKGSGLYLAGVSGDLVITVGTAATSAFDLSTGSNRWSVRHDAESGLPSGRAALTRDRVYLPLQGRSLRTIDLATATASDIALPSGEAPLGNLLLHRGKLVSYSAEGVTAFEERTGLATSVASQLKSDPADVDALVRLAESQLADGDPNAAAETLDRIPATAAGAESRRLRQRVLTELVRSGDGDADAHLRELTALAETPEERLAALRLQAEKALADGRVDLATISLFAIADTGEFDRMVADGDHSTVRLDAWLSGRFADLWADADEPDRAAITQEIRSRFTAARESDDRGRLARIFAFHPQAAPVARALAAEDLAAGRFAEAEARLLPLARGDSPDVLRARLDLAEAAAGLGLSADASAWIASLDRFDPQLTLPDGTPLSAARESLTSRLPPAAEEPANAWGDFRLSIVRSGAYTAAETVSDLRPESCSGPRLPYLRDRQLQLLIQQDRLAVSDASGVLERLIPLRVGNRAAGSAVSAADGHLLFLHYRNVAQLVSPTEGRVVWSTPADHDAGSFNETTGPQPMRPAGSVAASNGLIARARLREAMPAANADYVALRGRRDLTVLDAATGQVRWKRENIPVGAAIVGTESLLYVVPAHRGETIILRAADGRPFENPEALRNLRYAVAAVGDRLLTVTAEQSLDFFGLRLGRSVVALYDPHSGKNVWSRSLAQDALFELTDDGRLHALASDGSLAVLDPETGEPSPIGKVAPEALGRRNEVYLLSDAVSVYVVVNSGLAMPAYYPADIPAVAVHGDIFAFDRTGGLRWRRPIENRRLLCLEFDRLPVFLFADSEMTEKSNRTFWRVQLFALDKRTGEPVLDEPYYSQSPPYFRGLAVDPARRTIELGAYPIRLRLQAVPKPAEPAGAPAS